LPLLPNLLLQPFSEAQGYLNTFLAFEQGDSIANIVHDKLTGIAIRQMAGKLLTNGRIDVPIHIIVQRSQQVFTLHGDTSFCMIRPDRWRLHELAEHCHPSR
jgi:hypothetical protein